MLPMLSVTDCFIFQTLMRLAFFLFSFLFFLSGVWKPVASILGIPLENIFANQLLFGSSGEFVGFNKDEPTSKSGGKAVAVQQIRKVCRIAFFQLFQP